METEIIEKLHQKAREKDWKPWDLQDELRKISKNVVAVGDDLSFVLKFEKPIFLDFKKLLEIGGKKTKIYPYKNAVRFDEGYIAFNGKFLRISRSLSKEKLTKILELINLPED